MLKKYTENTRRGIKKGQPFDFKGKKMAVSQGFEPKHAPRLRAHTPANTHFRKFVNALKRVKTPSKIHEKYTNLNVETLK